MYPENSASKMLNSFCPLVDLSCSSTDKFLSIIHKLVNKSTNLIPDNKHKRKNQYPTYSITQGEIEQYNAVLITI